MRAKRARPFFSARDPLSFGGKRFDELLAALGARRIGERLENDSRSPTYPDDTAREWLEGWLETLRQSSDEANGAATVGAEISR